MITPDELESFKDEDRLEFENLPDKYKLHARRDLCGLLIMDMLIPGTRDILGGADHDVVYMDADREEVLAKCTLDDLRALRACGITLGEYDDFQMYV